MKRKEHKAFTLIEILLVIVIIGILSGMVVTRLSGRSREAKVARAQSDMKGNLSLALDLFEHDCGRYPTNDEGLSALVIDPGISGWKGPYVKGQLSRDPWGTHYMYSLHSEDSGRYIISSAGPDGQTGTGDDLSFGGIDEDDLPS